MKEPTQVLMVAGSPQTIEAAELKTYADQAHVIFAIDKGIDALRVIDCVPTFCVGDFDSAVASNVGWAREAGSHIVEAPREKDFSDLAMAFNLLRASQKNYSVLLCNALGGRLDHLLAVLGVVLEYPSIHTLIVGPYERVWLLREGEELTLQDELEASVSVLPLEKNCVVSERGMQWELVQEKLTFLSSRGISNIVKHDRASIFCDAGNICVIENR